MKNRLTDLNNHLFAAIERLNDEDIDPDELQKEIDRSRAVSGLAKDIIGNAKLLLDAQKAAFEWGREPREVPKIME